MKWNGDTLRQYVEENSTLKYLGFYRDEKSLVVLRLQCDCLTIFERKLEDFKRVKKCCIKCSKKEQNETLKIKNPKEQYLAYGLILNEQYKNNQFPHICETADGYKIKISLGNLKAGKIPSIAFKSNKYSIENINRWCKLNDKDFKCISSVYIKANSLLDWKCNRGHVWSANWNSINSGSGCPKCKKSKGEKRIVEILNKNNIKYIQQYTFSDLRGIKYPLRFDFAVLDENSFVKYLIEYQGEYHYNKRHTTHDIKTQQKYDNMKRDYCNKNNILLLEIPYWEFDNIENFIL